MAVRAGYGAEGATRKEVAILENHVSTATAQQSVLHFSAAELQQQQQQQQTRNRTVREQRVVTAVNRQHEDRLS